HLEIAPGASEEQVAQAALRFEDEIGRSSRFPVWYHGAFGHDVARFQAFLDDAGFAVGKVDGKAGDRTIGAVEAFQKSSGLKDDGRVGPLTLSAAGLDGPGLAGGPVLPDQGPTGAGGRGLEGPIVQTDEIWVGSRRGASCQRRWRCARGRRQAADGPIGSVSSEATGSGRRSPGPP